MSTNQTTDTRSAAGWGLTVIGGIMVVIVIIKGSIIGYYDTDLQWMAPVGLIGAALAWVGQKILGR